MQEKLLDQEKAMDIKPECFLVNTMVHLSSESNKPSFTTTYCIHLLRSDISFNGTLSC